MTTRARSTPVVLDVDRPSRHRPSAACTRGQAAGRCVTPVPGPPTSGGAGPAARAARRRAELGRRATVELRTAERHARGRAGPATPRSSSSPSTAGRVSIACARASSAQLKTVGGAAGGERVRETRPASSRPSTAAPPCRSSAPSRARARCRVASPLRRSRAAACTAAVRGGDVGTRRTLEQPRLEARSAHAGGREQAARLRPTALPRRALEPRPARRPARPRASRAPPASCSSLGPPRRADPPAGARRRATQVHELGARGPPGVAAPPEHRPRRLREATVRPRAVRRAAPPRRARARPRRRPAATPAPAADATAAPSSRSASVTRPAATSTRAAVEPEHRQDPGQETLVEPLRLHVAVQRGRQVAGDVVEEAEVVHGLRDEHRAPSRRASVRHAVEVRPRRAEPGRAHVHHRAVDQHLRDEHGLAARSRLRSATPYSARDSSSRPARRSRMARCACAIARSWREAAAPVAVASSSRPARGRPASASAIARLTLTRPRSVRASSRRAPGSPRARSAARSSRAPARGPHVLVGGDTRRVQVAAARRPQLRRRMVDDDHRAVPSARRAGPHPRARPRSRTGPTRPRRPSRCPPVRCRSSTPAARRRGPASRRPDARRSAPPRRSAGPSSRRPRTGACGPGSTPGRPAPRRRRRRAGPPRRRAARTPGPARRGRRGTGGGGSLASNPARSPARIRSSRASGQSLIGARPQRVAGAAARAAWSGTDPGWGRCCRAACPWPRRSRCSPDGPPGPRRAAAAGTARRAGRSTATGSGPARRASRAVATRRAGVGRVRERGRVGRGHLPRALVHPRGLVLRRRVASQPVSASGTRISSSRRTSSSQVVCTTSAASARRAPATGRRATAAG